MYLWKGMKCARLLSPNYLLGVSGGYVGLEAVIVNVNRADWENMLIAKLERFLSPPHTWEFFSSVMCLVYIESVHGDLSTVLFEPSEKGESQEEISLNRDNNIHTV